MAGDQAAAFTFSGVDLRIGWLNNYIGVKHSANSDYFFLLLRLKLLIELPGYIIEILQNITLIILYLQKLYTTNQR